MQVAFVRSLSILTGLKKHKPPTFSSDMKRPENLDKWYDLFIAIDPILQSINSLGDCIDYDTMQRYRHLKRKVASWKKIPLASIMSIHHQQNRRQDPRRPLWSIGVRDGWGHGLVGLISPCPDQSEWVRTGGYRSVLIRIWWNYGTLFIAFLSDWV